MSFVPSKGTVLPSNSETGFHPVGNFMEYPILLFVYVFHSAVASVEVFVLTAVSADRLLADQYTKTKNATMAKAMTAMGRMVPGRACGVFMFFVWTIFSFGVA